MTTKTWPPPNDTPELYKRAWLTVLTLFFCFPVGLILMWVYQKSWHVAVKSIITMLYVLFIVGFIGSVNNDASKLASQQSQTTPAISATLTRAQKQQAIKEQAAQAIKIAQHQKEKDAKAVALAKHQEEENERKQAEVAKQQARQLQKQAEYNQTHFKNDGLILDEKSMHWVRDTSGFASFVTGKVTNDSGDDLDYAEVSFKELDGEGSQIGTARDNITHLANGATWKFKCIILEDSTKHIQLDELKTTPF